MSDTDFSLLDLPRPAPIEDPEAYLQAAVRWHFSPQTGSRFWLQQAKSLDLDPITDVKTFEDLALFPNIVDELREVAVGDLIPAGYGPKPPNPRVFESGGTTGAPKRVTSCRTGTGRPSTGRLPSSAATPACLTADCCS
jgi:hypothetical protein